MRVHSFSNLHEANEEVTKRIRELVQKEKDAVFALAAGKTPLGLYQMLVDQQSQGELDLRGVHAFSLDEFEGLSFEHHASFGKFLMDHWVSPLGLPSENVHFLRGSALDLEEECRSYEEKIVSLGGIDLAILGLGQNGHIAFNEPGSLIDGRTRVVKLSPWTLKKHGPEFGGIDQVPKKALTIGMGTLMESRRLFLLVYGEEKSEIVKRGLEGKVTEDCPVSLLRDHPNLHVFLDEGAAGLLSMV